MSGRQGGWGMRTRWEISDLGVASEIWKETYGCGGGEPDVLALIYNKFPNADEEIVAGYVKSILLFGVRWVHGGCVTITSTHKFAAALCSTVADSRSVDDLKLPADAVRVLVPDGVLVFGSQTIRTADVIFGGSEGYCIILRYEDGGADSVSFTSLHELLAEDATYANNGAEDWDSRKRLFLVARRLVCGLLLTMQYTTNWTERVSKGGPSHRHGPPPHRNIFIGRPISVDCRQAVTDYVNGDRPHGPPSVQTLVRGHYKRQVFGAERQSRKVIWIEPYWRGPEDAPILARPHLVGA